MPSGFVLELLQGGTLTALPRVHTVKDIPHCSRRKVTKALELCLTRLAADAHDKAPNTVYYLVARWVLTRDSWQAEHAGSAGGALRGRCPTASIRHCPAA